MYRAYAAGGVDTPIRHVGGQLIPTTYSSWGFRRAWSTFALLSAVLTALAESLRRSSFAYLRLYHIKVRKLVHLARNGEQFGCRDFVGPIWERDSFWHRKGRCRWSQGVILNRTPGHIVDTLDLVYPHLMQKGSLVPFQQLMLTLMKLRLGLPQADLGYRFQNSQSTVSRIFAIPLMPCSIGCDG